MNQTIRDLSEQLDQPHMRRTPLPVNELQPPPYGEAQTSGVNSVVGSIVDDICRKINDLRETLDEVEQQILVGAAAAKTALHDQISVCVRVNDEILHMRKVVEENRTTALHER